MSLRRLLGIPRDTVAKNPDLRKGKHPSRLSFADYLAIQFLSGVLMARSSLLLSPSGAYPPGGCLTKTIIICRVYCDCQTKIGDAAVDFGDEMFRPQLPFCPVFGLTKTTIHFPKRIVVFGIGESTKLRADRSRSQSLGRVGILKFIRSEGGGE